MVDTQAFQKGMDRFLELVTSPFNPIASALQSALNPENIRQFTLPSDQLLHGTEQRVADKFAPQSYQVPGMGNYEKQALDQFTPFAQYQLNAVPVQYTPATQGLKTGGGVSIPKDMEGAWIDPGLGNGYNQSIDFANPLYAGPHLMTHEYLHTAVRGFPGINWQNFLDDYSKTVEENPQFANHMDKFLLNESQGYAQSGQGVPPEELFAESGATLGPSIFKTPLGKYYKGILEQP